MRLIFTVITILFSMIFFTNCSKKLDEPYYDRAKQASAKAQNQLSKD